MIWYHIILYDMILYYMIWYDIILYDMIWYYIIYIYTYYTHAYSWDSTNSKKHKIRPIPFYKQTFCLDVCIGWQVCGDDTRSVLKFTAKIAYIRVVLDGEIPTPPPPGKT